jgi:type III pantothenate kinase
VLLVADVGNTTIHIGIYGSGRLHREYRLRSRADDLPDDLAIRLSGLLGSAPQVEAAAIGSVVANLGENLQAALSGHFGIEAELLRPETVRQADIRVQPPSSLGIDRLANLFGAEELLAGGRYAVAVDLGTATSFDVLQGERTFLGGIIGAGLASTAGALSSAASRLPRVPLEPPPSAIGHNTQEAMQSGLVLGHAAMVDGMLARIQAELPGPAAILLTGGYAGLIAPLLRTPHQWRASLTLDGLKRIWELTRQPPS